MLNNVLPLHLKQTFPPMIWIFTEGDEIESWLPFKIFSTLIKSEFRILTIFCYFVIGGNSRSKLVNFGTKPDKKKLADWKNSKDPAGNPNFNPIPIKAEFTPIVNLFSTANLDEKHNISSTAILQWFLPLYLKYCKVRKILAGK